MLILLLLLLAGLVVAALAGVLPWMTERPRLGASLSLPLLAGAGLVVLILMVGLAVGLRGPGSDEPGPRPRPRPAGPNPTSTTASTAIPSNTPSGIPATTPVSAALGPVVRLVAEDAEGAEDTFPPSYDIVDGLVPNTVLRVRVSGFEPFARARAEQCVTTTSTSCGNSLEVQFGPEGRASFQYLVLDDAGAAPRTGQCRAGGAPCSLAVRQVEGPGSAEVQTVFHGEIPPPGRIRVTPKAGLADGQRVTVSVEDYPPGAQVQAMLCAPPDATGRDRCGAPGPTAPVTIGPDGTGSTTLTVRAGPVGRQRVACGRGVTCGVSVASDTVFARAPVVPVTFAGPPGADYDAGRLVTGLAAAALLLATAGWLVRRTDWSPVGEEAAPEIDDAEYADLDALVAALPPEDPDEAFEGGR